MPHSYVSLDGLKAAITIGDSADDGRLRAVLEAVSRMIDDETRRTFRTYLGTRYLTAGEAGRLLLDADLLAVTTLKGDVDGARTYADAWAATDYDLVPDNAAAERTPYWAIEATPDGAFSFPSGLRRGVEVVGKWGYWEDLLAVSTLGAAVATTTATSITLSAGHGLEALQTILVDAEQMYLSGFTATNVATVERGVNGTTAATHLIGATVSLYRYPAPIVEATRLQAARLFQRVHAPFGIQGSAEMGTAAVISRIDPDVKMLLQHYKSGLGMVA